MNSDEIASYQELRRKNGLPEISNEKALIEAQALINFLSTGY